MEEILSEEELMKGKESTWGQWKFSISNDEIDRKLASLPKLPVVDKNYEHWSKLFSVLHKEEKSLETELSDSAPDHKEIADIPMECSSLLRTEENEPLENDDGDDSCTEELVLCLVDLCNQVAPKLKQGLNIVQEEMSGFTQDLSKVKETTLVTVMISAWSQLNSDASRLCFCIPFTSSNQMCKKVCENIIKPWLSKRPPSKIEQLSAILIAEGETVCLHLVVPLLKIQDSPLARDILTLEELMSSMTEKHWSVLLRELLKDLRELQKWQIPSLAVIVEHAKPTSDEVYQLIQLMSSSGTVYALNRDFGALLVAVAEKLCANDVGLALQLKLIATNYKGPLKFKTLKILEEVKD